MNYLLICDIVHFFYNHIFLQESTNKANTDIILSDSILMSIIMDKNIKSVGGLFY